jgi:hypothetical protein
MSLHFIGHTEILAAFWTTETASGSNAVTQFYLLRIGTYLSASLQNIDVNSVDSEPISF